MANKFIKSFNFGGEDNYFPLPFVTDEHNGMVLKVVDGEWKVTDLIPKPVFIEFTVDDVTYNAEEGMTWEEWCDSEYNTGGFNVGLVYEDYDDDNVYGPSNDRYFCEMIENVAKTDVIENGYVYEVFRSAIS